MCQNDVFETREEIRDDLKVKVELIMDYHLSYMGQFSDKWQPGAIKHNRDNRHGVYNWFIPTPGCGEWEDYYRDARAYYKRKGYSRHEAHILADRARFQDYKFIMDIENGNAYLFGIVAKVFSPSGDILLGESSCWGYWWTGSQDQDQIETDIEDHILEALAQVPEQANLIMESIKQFA